MPNPYIDNAERWLALAEIDYLNQFVKAWIPFNAWYKNSFPSLKTDRDLINEIKSNHNLFRDRLIALLRGSTNDDILFKSHISSLHKLLESRYIPNASKRISLTNITVERNPNTVVIESFRRWVYKIELTSISNSQININTLITDSNGTTQYTFNQSKYDLEGLLGNISSLSSITATRRFILANTYLRIDPLKPISLISSKPKNSIPAGDIYLIDDVDKLSKGLIEIIYRLRNILFHGELIPSNDNKMVYEPAYNILKTLIQSLK